jgi:stage II sporulation protein P
MEQSEMLTLMELENNRLGQEIHIEVPRPTNPPEKNNVTEYEQVARINLEELEEYETLVKRFYTIDAITNIGPEELNAKKLGNMDLTMKQTPDQPQILIYHTHSQEAYADSVPGDDTTTIMGVGEHLKDILKMEYGYNVIHHTGKYDVQSRDNAYSKALPEIKRVLEENPSIEVVIDLHRDAVADETRLVMDLDGRPTAKFMFFNGISRTTKTGKIDYLHNPNLETNLAFSFQAKWRAEEYYPGLTRRNYINAYRYNMHLSPKAMLLELGAQNNTLEEAMNACEPIAHILHIVLSGEF